MLLLLLLFRMLKLHLVGITFIYTVLCSWNTVGISVRFGAALTGLNSQVVFCSSARLWLLSFFFPAVGVFSRKDVRRAVVSACYGMFLVAL